jgi:hypothetical protein
MLANTKIRYPKPNSKVTLNLSNRVIKTACLKTAQFFTYSGNQT